MYNLSVKYGPTHNLTYELELLRTHLNLKLGTCQASCQLPVARRPSLVLPNK